jgi:hypothetical protein
MKWLFLIISLGMGSAFAQPFSPNDMVIRAIKVAVAAVTSTCQPISGAVQRYPITAVTMTGSGGCPGSYTFSASGLPSGLSISSSGTISGTPTVNGTFNYTATINDTCTNSGTVNCSVTISR